MNAHAPHGPVIRTASGLDVPLAAPRLEHIRFRDIAQHLAQINMFRGACRLPIPMAQFSLLTVDILKSGRHPPAICLLGLLHRAHNAYTHDLGPNDWSIHTCRTLSLAIQCAAGITAAAANDTGHIVTMADRIAVATVWRDMMPGEPPTWLEDTVAHPRPVKPMKWMAAEEVWLDTFSDLTIAAGLTPVKGAL